MLDAPLEVAMVVCEGEGVDPDGGTVAPGGPSSAGGCSDGAPRGRGGCYWERAKDMGQKVKVYPAGFMGNLGFGEAGGTGSVSRLGLTGTYGNYGIWNERHLVIG